MRIAWNVISKKIYITLGSKISFLSQHWVFLTVVHFLLGISGSLNFDEEETDGEEEEGKQLRSRSLHSEAERPNSASSQKSTTVCNSGMSFFGAYIFPKQSSVFKYHFWMEAPLKDLSSHLDFKFTASLILCLKPAMVMLYPIFVLNSFTTPSIHILI